VQAREAEAAAGQGSLFDAGPSEGPRPEPPLPNLDPWPEQERLAREKEAVGFFISGHPLDRFRDLARAFGPANTGNLGEFSGQEIELPCVVTKVTRQIMRKDSSEWGRLTVEDFAGTASVLAFGTP
jgi:DNA polymerase-3 subunit alpha